MTDADRDNPDAETREFLSHPETAEAGRLIMEAVQREGDRGAMLVAGEMLAPDDAGEVRASAQRFLRRPQPSGSSGGAV